MATQRMRMIGQEGINLHGAFLLSPTMMDGWEVLVVVAGVGEGCIQDTRCMQGIMTSITLQALHGFLLEWFRCMVTIRIIDHITTIIHLLKLITILRLSSEVILPTFLCLLK